MQLNLTRLMIDYACFVHCMVKQRVNKYVYAGDYLFHILLITISPFYHP